MAFRHTCLNCGNQWVTDQPTLVCEKCGASTNKHIGYAEEEKKTEVKATLDVEAASGITASQEATSILDRFVKKEE